MAFIYEDTTASKRIAGLNQVGKQILDKLATITKDSPDSDIAELKRLIQIFFNNCYTKQEMDSGLLVIMRNCYQYAKSNGIPKLEQFCLASVEPMRKKYDMLGVAETVKQKLSQLRSDVLNIANADPSALAYMESQLSRIKVGLSQYKSCFPPQLFDQMARDTDLIDQEIRKAVSTRIGRRL